MRRPVSASPLGMPCHLPISGTISHLLVVVVYTKLSALLQSGQMLHASGKFVPSLVSQISDQLESPEDGEVLKKYQALVILGYNCLTALAFSGVLVILKVNNAVNRINWHSGIAWTSFIAFVSSLILVGALGILGLAVGEAIKDSDKEMLESSSFSGKE